MGTTHTRSQDLRRLILSRGRLAQVEVLQLALGIAHGDVGVAQHTAGAVHLPGFQLAPLHGTQLQHDLIIGLLVVFKLDAGGDGDDALLPVIDGRGKIAQGQLLPHVQKELGVAAAAEEGVAHQQGGHIVAVAGKAHAQLALGHVHGLFHIAGLRGAGVGHGGGTFIAALSGQRGKCLAQCRLHPLQRRAAAVNELQAAGGDQLPILGIELLGLQALGVLFPAQAADAVRLPGAHLLQQAGVGIVPLIVDQAADGVDEVCLFTFKIGGHKPAMVGHRLTDQLAHQLCHRLQKLLPAGDEAVVNKAGHKANALVLPFFPDRIVHPCAVEVIHPGGQGSQVGIGDGAPPQNRCQQRVGSHGLVPQRRHELGGEEARLEFSGGQVRQVYPLGQLF